MNILCRGLLSMVGLLVVARHCAATYTDEFYPTKRLNDYCDGTRPALIPLPCLSTAADRAGSLIFSQYPANSCNFTLSVGFAAPCSTQYAIYINVRALDFKTGDIMEIYENSNKVRELFGGRFDQPFNVRPASHGQLLSQYGYSPSFDFGFVKSSSNGFGDPHDSLILDYIVVRKNMRDPAESTCQAFNGSILDEHYCETGNRVNCPSSYSAVSYVTSTEIDRPGAVIPSHCTKALLYAGAADGQIRPAMNTDLSSQDDSRWSSSHVYSSHNVRLSATAITFIVLGPVCTVALLTLLITKFCCNKNRKLGNGSSKPGAAGSVPPYISHLSNDNYAFEKGSREGFTIVPLPVARDFLGAPPAYSLSVEEQGPTKDAPKF